MIVYGLFDCRELFGLYATQDLARAAADERHANTKFPPGEPEFIPWEGDAELLTAPGWGVMQLEVISE